MYKKADISLYLTTLKDQKEIRYMEKNCLECGTRIIGRADKKFCNDSCRNSYNNKFNKENS